MGWGRFAARMAAGGAIAVLVMTPAPPAGGQGADGCSATMAGIDVRGASSPGDAIKVDADDQLSVEASSTSTLTRYEVELEFAGFRWPVADGEVSGSSWSDTVAVDDYATYGVGLYKVHGVSFDGTEEVCRGTAYVKVGGKVPVATVAGAAGVAAVLGGAALLLVGGRRP